MSENESKTLPAQPDPRMLGMTQKEMTELQAYIEAGVPGVTSVKPDAVVQMMQMFMEGASYHEIGNKTRVKREIILYYSYKYGWATAKQQHIDDLVANLNSKIEVQALENASFIVETASFLRGYFREKMELYERTKDPDVFKGINFKLLDKYVKLIDIMDGKRPIDSKNPPAAQQGPTVNVHAASGSTVNLGSPSDGKVDQGSLLKSFADLERAKEEATRQKKG